MILYFTFLMRVTVKSCGNVIRGDSKIAPEISTSDTMMSAGISSSATETIVLMNSTGFDKRAHCLCCKAVSTKCSTLARFLLFDSVFSPLLAVDSLVSSFCNIKCKAIWKGYVYWSCYLKQKNSMTFPHFYSQCSKIGFYILCPFSATWKDEISHCGLFWIFQAKYWLTTGISCSKLVSRFS